MMPQNLRWLVLVLLFGFVLWMRAAPPALAAAPANDDFDSAISIPALPFTNTSNTNEATTDSDDPIDCHSNGSVWYAFTPATDMQLQANTFGSGYDTTLAVYTGIRGALTLVACNDDSFGVQSQVTFDATGGTTYYVLVGFCCGSYGGTGGGNLVFSVEEVLSPANDNFVSATMITELPFNDIVEIGLAGLEPDEPNPTCINPGDLTDSVWYSFTPTQIEWFVANIYGPVPVVAVYTGSSIDNLTQIECRAYGETLSFVSTPGTTYYFQLGNLYGYQGIGSFSLDVAGAPVADFYYYPNPPSVYEVVQFFDNSYDPAGSGIASQNWDFGDGTTATGCCPTHRYAADGEYVVTLTVTTADARQASTMRTLRVDTHDVAITKFTTPKSSRVGHTNRIVVGINSRLQSETVTVVLYRTVPGGFQQIGILSQYVPKQSSNRTTDFLFSYTFTPEDAAIGKVTFRAIAYIENVPDALPGDNEAISFPTKVTGASAAAAGVIEEVEMQESFLLRSQMGDDAEIGNLFLLPTRWIYLPLIDINKD